MKIRGDFVTNSSSTSYIIGWKMDKNLKPSSSLEKLLINIFNTHSVCDESKVDKWTNDMFGWSEDEKLGCDRTADKEEIKQAIRDGYLVMYIDIPYGEDNPFDAGMPRGAIMIRDCN